MSGVAQYLEGSLLTQLQTWLTANSTVLATDPVAYPNREFTPPDASLTAKSWLRVTFIPAETQQASVGDAGMNLMSGIMLINVFSPKGANAGPANALADSLVTAYKRGTNCPAVSGYVARIEKAWRSMALPDERWFNVPVRVKWFQQVTNT